MMKLYLVMHDCRTSWRGVAGWLTNNASGGLQAFVRLKDAKEVVARHPHLRVVKFETDDMGRDARKTRDRDVSDHKK